VHKIPLLSGRGLFIDTNIITGHGFDGFRVPVYWGGVPYGYPFFMPKEEFIECYKKSAIKLGGSRLKLAEVGIMPDKIICKHLIKYTLYFHKIENSISTLVKS
jgi:hypothetical protein